jgi:RNase P subunit RPR2
MENADEPESLMDLVFNKRGKTNKEEKSLLGKKLFPYKTVMCRSCGKIQVTQGEEMFRCRECAKINRYRKYGQWNVKLKDFPSFEAAMIEAKRWAMEEGKKDEEKRAL